MAQFHLKRPLSARSDPIDVLIKILHSPIHITSKVPHSEGSVNEKVNFACATVHPHKATKIQTNMSDEVYCMWRSEGISVRLSTIGRSIKVQN